MYVCGITVYDYCHIGHARMMVVFDVVQRWLRALGYQVTYVRNITDIDDKIIRRAVDQGIGLGELTARYIAAMYQDLDALRVQRPDHEPRATQFVPQMLGIIRRLVDRGFAYQVAPDFALAGDVHFAVRKFAPYGRLSGRTLDDLRAGERVKPGEGKLDPLDFVLWKSSKEGEPSEAIWESEFGQGRPGWHIECSAMSESILGTPIDIHGGGNDLIFPHHENEIAQSEAATGKPLANYWLHNGMVKVDGEKMSKSLGNFTTIRDLLARPVDPMAVRLFILQAHYSKPVDFTTEALEGAEKGWQTLNDGLLFGNQFNWELSSDSQIIDEIAQRFQTVIDDDFNFAEGLAILFEIAKELRRQGNLFKHQGATTIPLEELQKQWYTLVKLAGVLGFIPEITPETTTSGLTDGEIENLIQQRQQARQQKNYQESDRLRDQLQTAGITLIDQPGGVTRWHRN